MSAQDHEDHVLAVHDFVRIDLPFGAVVGAFTHFVDEDLLRRLVADAWVAESAAVAALGTRESAGAPTELRCSLGAVRSRRDAVVISVTWTRDVDRQVPPLEADLEVVSFGPSRSHIHLLGVSRLSPGVQPFTERASIEQRIAVALVRHVLHAIADRILAEVAIASSLDPDASVPDESVDNDL